MSVSTNPPVENDIGLVNLRWAQALTGGLVAAGISHLVLSPGSRSTPLALAFLRQPGVRCHVLLDERSAAFFALGLARASRKPVALLCTSGSAPANWFPAVIEADADAIPLILLSADRPPEFQGWGANQTIDQTQLFGQHVRAFHAPGAAQGDCPQDYLRRLAVRAVSESRWPHAGPVHINLPFREPLLPSGTPDSWPQPAPLQPIAIAAPHCVPDSALIAATAAVMDGQSGVIVCGGGDYPADFADAVSALARRMDCPVFAEPLSTLRFGAHDRSRICVRYESFLAASRLPAQGTPRWLLRFGAFPLSRALQRWLGQCAAAEHIVVSADKRWPDPQHQAGTVLQGDAIAVCQALLAAEPGAAPAQWQRAFRQAEAAVEKIVGDYLQLDDFAGALVATLLDRLPAGYQLFCGNSLSIREFDTFSGSANKTLRVFGNRGASGIDGNLSTALGIASAAGPTVALVGDLTAQHDLTALAAARDVEIIIIVINNGGGGIFDYLPQAALPEFERAWLTPQTIDFGAAAQTFALPYAKAASLRDFAQALDAALRKGGATLIEAVMDRQKSVALHRAYRDALAFLRT